MQKDLSCKSVWHLGSSLYTELSDPAPVTLQAYAQPVAGQAPAPAYAQPQPAYAQPQAYQYPPQPSYYNPDEVRTIFVTGFPQDVRERELKALLRFIPGYEVRACMLPIFLTVYMSILSQLTVCCR